MTTIREVLSEAASAISIAAFIEGAVVVVILWGILVAFVLSVMP
jgi:hypothetical protein